MAPLPIIPNVIRAAVRGQISGGGAFVNVLHFVKPTAVAYATAIPLIEAQISLLYLSGYTSPTVPSMLSFCPNEVTTSDVTLTPLDGASASTVITMSGTGGVTANDPLPPNVSLVATHRTAFRGPRNRGRTYMPNFSTQALTSTGKCLGTTVTSLEALWSRFRLGIEAIATDYHFVVASYSGGTWNIVTTTNVNNEYDHQDRRKR